MTTDGVNSEEVQQAPDAAVEISASEIEAQMIAAAEARAQDPTEMAATVYNQYMPYFVNALPKLSTRGLRRVLNYLVKYPFHQEDLKMANDFERDLMGLANCLIEAKFVMIMDQYKESAEQLYEASQKDLTTEETNAIIEELKEPNV